MGDQKLMIAARKKNGQIGYLSEGLSLPEFADLFKTKGDVRVLVDYSLIIEKLHELHRSASSDDILKKYNAMFNYWQDSKTYTKESLKIAKCEGLSQQANALINELHIKLQKSESEFNVKLNSSLHGLRQIAESIRKDSNIYIDTLLCFIHSKASLDIESFRNDTVLFGYGKFLHELISRIYGRLLREGIHQNSFLKFIAFEQPEKLQHYLDLEGKEESSDKFLLRIVKSERPYGGQGEGGNYYKELSIRYDSFHPDFVSIVDVFMELLHKICSVIKFIELLREGVSEWDDSSNAVDELREDIRLIK